LTLALLSTGAWAADLVITGTAGGPTPADLGGSVKLKTNSVSYSAIANFGNSIIFNSAFKTYYKIVTDGGFKAGDVISFTHAFNNSDDTKEAKIGIYSDKDNELFVSVQGVNGRLSNDDPAVQTYTLTADYDSLCLGRVGNTRVYLLTLTVSRATGACPSGLTISGSHNYKEGEDISLSTSLEDGDGDISYQWYKGGTAEANKLTGKTSSTLTISGCELSDAGNYYCIASKAECDDAVSSAYAVAVAPFFAVSDKFWNFSDWTTGEIAEKTVYDNLELLASDAKKLGIDGNNKSIDGIDFTQRLKFGGNGSTTERCVHFKIAGNNVITVYGMSSSKNAERTIDINIGGVVVAQLTNDGNAIDKVTYAYFGGETDVYVYSSNSGNNIYGIKVEPFALHAADVDFYGLFMPAEAVIPSGITAYTGVLNPAETELALTQVSGTVIPANTPVLVKANAAGTYAFAPSNTGADAIASSLKGVAVETTVASIEAANTGKKCLTLGENSGVVAFRQPAGESIAANKVYLLVNTSSPAPSVIRIVENTTNIENVEANEAAVKYIENGKLYIKKNGVTYNVVGAVVK